MNRRYFLQTLTAVAAVVGFKPSATRDGMFGYVDIDIAQANGWLGGTVLLDGQDISKNCYAFDDRLGVAYCYKRNSNGNLYAEWNSDGSRQHAAREERHGRVQFFPKGRA